MGRYRLHRPIASGGMAGVYVANTDTKEGFTKILAVKVIHEHLARDPSFVEMFLDEARIAAQIDHANVCSVFDFGESDGTYFIAMEYMVGETFASVRDVMRQREYAPEWPRIAASMAAQACEGLHAAHSLSDANGGLVGLVHRDVSPQNLFITYSGVAKVMDFGIARAEGRSHHTAPGTIKGKFAYLAPEQLTAANDVDRRADVWALGVTLWEMLTLRPLFRRSGAAETLTAVMNRVIDPPSKYHAEVPEELDRVVLRALARDRNERYATAREFGRALAACFQEQAGLARTVELEEWLERSFPDGRHRHSLTASITRELADLRTHASIPVVDFDSRDSQPSESRIMKSALPREGTREPTASAAATPSERPPARRATRSFGPVLVIGAVVLAAVAAFLGRPRGEHVAAEPSPRAAARALQHGDPPPVRDVARRDARGTGESAPASVDGARVPSPLASTSERAAVSASDMAANSMARRARGRADPAAAASAPGPAAASPAPPPPRAMEALRPSAHPEPAAAAPAPPPASAAGALERNPYLRSE